MCIRDSAEGGLPSCPTDELRPAHADAGHAQKGLQRRAVHLHGKEVQVVQSPVRLRIDIGGEEGVDVYKRQAEDGTLSLVGVARGRKKGIRQLAEYYKKNVDDAGQAHVAIVGHADCPKDAARLKEALEKEAPGLLCLVCNIGPVIGSHVGTDMLAVVFWGHDKRENLSVADRIARKVKGDK